MRCLLKISDEVPKKDILYVTPVVGGRVDLGGRRIIKNVEWGD